MVLLSSSNVGVDYAELNNAGRYGIRAQDGGCVGGYQPNIKNSVNAAIYSIGGYVSTMRVNLSGLKIGISADRGAKINASQSNISCLSRGVHAKNGAQIDASDSTIRGSEFSVNANFGSNICVTNSDCRADGSTESTKDLQASNGSFISVKNAQGGTNTPINKFGENGAIFK